MTKKFKLRKINRTSVAYPHYVWQVKFTRLSPILTAPVDAFTDYVEAQRWCQDSWGHSLDYNLLTFPFVEKSGFLNPAWCYQANIREHKFCIYLSEDAMTLFLLKWNCEV